MKLKIFQIDAFAENQFGGNPAAVVPLDNWLPDSLMQKIALENNLSETAFYTSVNNEFEIRWFTPTVEVNLCGHATLAAAHVIFQHYNFNSDIIRFRSKSGLLEVSSSDNQYTMIFPTDKIKQVSAPVEILKSFSIESLETYLGRDDYMVIVESQRIIENLKPDFKLLAGLDSCRGVIITAIGKDVDFVSRCFYPQSGVDEDPATGSAYTTMTPYWSKKLNKKELNSIQLSQRKGFFACKDLGDQVAITGKAITFLEGEINVEPESS